jgi:hypothetical protein
MIRADPALHLEEFRIAHAETGEVLAWEGRPSSVEERDRPG